jgi:hypothetical protein
VAESQREEEAMGNDEDDGLVARMHLPRLQLAGRGKPINIYMDMGAEDVDALAAATCRNPGADAAGADAELEPTTTWPRSASTREMEPASI